MDEPCNNIVSQFEKKVLNKNDLNVMHSTHDLCRNKCKKGTVKYGRQLNSTTDNKMVNYQTRQGVSQLPGELKDDHNRRDRLGDGASKSCRPDQGVTTGNYSVSINSVRKDMADQLTNKSS
jgi:hypothetical protein